MLRRLGLQIGAFIALPEDERQQQQSEQQQQQSEQQHRQNEQRHHQPTDDSDLSEDGRAEHQVLMEIKRGQSERPYADQKLTLV